MSINVSDYNYTLACSLPVVQQIVGPLSLVKNVIGTMADISSAVFALESFTSINDEIEEVQRLIVKTTKKLKKLRVSNQTLKAALKSSNVFFEVDLRPPTQSLLDQQTKWNLPPPSIGFKALFDKTCGCSKTPLGQYERLNCLVDYQILTEIERLRSAHNHLEMKKCVPICDRLDNIANSILTTIPVIGTLYNLPHLRYST